MLRALSPTKIDTQCMKYGGITARICAVIKPGLGSDKIGFYSLQCKETLDRCYFEI